MSGVKLPSASLCIKPEYTKLEMSRSASLSANTGFIWAGLPIIPSRNVPPTSGTNTTKLLFIRTSIVKTESINTATNAP